MDIDKIRIAVAEERRKALFFKKVDKAGPIPAHCTELGNCWQWKACLNNRGYGQFWNGQKNIMAHHFLLSVVVPVGMDACHKCDNTKCVRPSHIFIGTRSENMKDCVSKGRNAPTWKSGGFASMKASQPNLKGVENPSHKLTHEEAIEALNCSRTKGAATRLAARLGVTVGIITGIRNGSRWKHLQDLRVKGKWTEKGAGTV